MISCMKANNASGSTGFAVNNIRKYGIGKAQ